MPTLLQLSMHLIVALYTHTNQNTRTYMTALFHPYVMAALHTHTGIAARDCNYLCA